MVLKSKNCVNFKSLLQEFNKKEKSFFKMVVHHTSVLERMRGSDPLYIIPGMFTFW